MKLKYLTRGVLIAIAAGLSMGVAAQGATADQRAAAKQKWESMTPEEKAAAKKKLEARWESMTPEEQATAKKRFAARHPQAAAKMAEQQKPAASAPK